MSPSEPDKTDPDTSEAPHSAERKSFLELTRQLAGLPLDQAAASLETSAAIASISLEQESSFYALLLLQLTSCNRPSCGRGASWVGVWPWAITKPR